MFVGRAVPTYVSRCEVEVTYQTLELAAGFAPILHHVDGTRSCDELLGHLRKAAAPDKLTVITSAVCRLPILNQSESVLLVIVPVVQLGVVWPPWQLTLEQLSEAGVKAAAPLLALKVASMATEAGAAGVPCRASALV